MEPQYPQYSEKTVKKNDLKWHQNFTCFPVRHVLEHRLHFTVKEFPPDSSQDFLLKPLPFFASAQDKFMLQHFGPAWDGNVATVSCCCCCCGLPEEWRTLRRAPTLGTVKL